MKVAISGAGVAGTALAYWLHRTDRLPVAIKVDRASRYVIPVIAVLATAAMLGGYALLVLSRLRRAD